jgi:hypothetical protein
MHPSMHRPTSVSESKQVGSAASWSDTTCFRARKMTLSLPFPKGHTVQAFGCEICLGRKLLCRESLSPCLCIRSRNASRFGAMALVRCITDYLGCCHGPDVDLAGRAGLGDHNDNFSILVKTFGPIRQGGVVSLLSRSLSFEVVSKLMPFKKLVVKADGTRSRREDVGTSSHAPKHHRRIFGQTFDC